MSSFVRNEKAKFDAVTSLIFDRPRSSGIGRLEYIESNDLGRKRCPVSGIERIREFRVFYYIKKIEGKKWRPMKLSGFMRISVLSESGFTVHLSALTYQQSKDYWMNDCWLECIRYRVRCIHDAGPMFSRLVALRC